MIIHWLKKVHAEAQFRPTGISYLINPFCIARNDLYQAMKALPAIKYEAILDVGCGTKPYEHLFNSKTYVGLEYDSERSRKYSKADFFYLGGKLPFDDQSFDLVICNQVLEHVFTPQEFLSEINRVLKPDGKLVLTVPFCWDEHEQPYDFGRYTSFGINYLMKENGFDLIDYRKLTPGIAGIVQLSSGHIYKLFYRRLNRATLIFTAPINIIGKFLSMLFPKNDEFYLDNFVFARKK